MNQELLGSNEEMVRKGVVREWRGSFKAMGKGRGLIKIKVCSLIIIY